jgi:hypothetical protein
MAQVTARYQRKRSGVYRQVSTRRSRRCFVIQKVQNDQVGNLEEGRLEDLHADENIVNLTQGKLDMTNKYEKEFTKCHIRHSHKRNVNRILDESTRMLDRYVCRM